MINLEAHFSAILSFVGNAKLGLTKPIFLFVSQLTPMVNVDLLIQNAQGQTLLTWRHDEFYGPGWHVPGGVIRFKETAQTRISQVAKSELSVDVLAEKTPMCVKEVMAPNRDVRGHFISMLYRCELQTPLPENKAFDANHPENGHWQWHDHSPEKLIHQHQMYQAFMDAS